MTAAYVYTALALVGSLYAVLAILAYLLARGESRARARAHSCGKIAMKGGETDEVHPQA